MKNRKQKLLQLSLIIFLFSFNCSYTSASDKEKEIAWQSFLVSAITTRSSNSQTSSASPNCTTASPTFSTLKAAGFETSCGRSGCHDGTTRYQASNYTQVKGFTSPGNASGSTLYIIQSRGNMAVYSNSTIDSALYCWIQGGANP
ncbi:MAG: hypothetical protein SH817_11025 [Leptospira sp.]|nr:hypothetical protein [Leptospira sp.]